MRRVIPLVVVATLAAAPGTGISTPGAASGAEAGALQACGPAHSHTLSADRIARVYEIRAGVYGCVTGGAAFRLGDSSTACIGATRIGPVRLAGSIAAFAAERCGVDTGQTSVVVERLGNGRRLANVAAGNPPGPESYTTVTAIVVRPSGAAAWIAVSSALGRAATVVEVWRLLGSRSQRLDAGPGIERRSLRLHGRRLSWRDGGRTRTAHLG